MSFDDFEDFLDTLCTMSNEQPPNFVVKKDLYNYFDSKKDGHIDLSEWQQVFKKIEVKFIIQSIRMLTLTRFQSNPITYNTLYSIQMEELSLSSRLVKNSITFLNSFPEIEDF